MASPCPIIINQSNKGAGTGLDTAPLLQIYRHQLRSKRTELCQTSIPDHNIYMTQWSAVRGKLIDEKEKIRKSKREQKVMSKTDNGQSHVCVRVQNTVHFKSLKGYLAKYEIKLN